jgi:hypothetical protein
MSEVIATLNSPESLLYTSVQSASVCLDLEELRLRFRTARTPRLSKRHIGNCAFFCNLYFKKISILKGWSWGYSITKAVSSNTNNMSNITRLLMLYGIAPTRDIHSRVAPQLTSSPSIVGARCTVSKTGSIVTESTCNNRLELALLAV